MIAFPTAAQRSDSDNAYVFEEGEVYGFNVIVTDGDRAVRAAPDFPSREPGRELTGTTAPSLQFKTADTSRTTIFSKTQSTYQLKMKTSRATFSEISQKAGSFPFTLRLMEDETRARMGVRECVQHNLVRGYDLLYVSLILSVCSPLPV